MANPGRSLREAGDQSSLKLGFFTDDYFKKEVIADSATNWIFEGPNDLVVDTGSMVDLGGDDFKLKLAAAPRDFKTNDKVWHCNYFRQPETIEYITTQFT